MSAAKTRIKRGPKGAGFSVQFKDGPLARQYHKLWDCSNTLPFVWTDGNGKVWRGQYAAGAVWVDAPCAA